MKAFVWWISRKEAAYQHTSARFMMDHGGIHEGVHLASLTKVPMTCIQRMGPFHVDFDELYVQHFSKVWEFLGLFVLTGGQRQFAAGENATTLSVTLYSVLIKAGMISLFAARKQCWRLIVADCVIFISLLTTWGRTCTQLRWTSFLPSPFQVWLRINTGKSLSGVKYSKNDSVTKQICSVACKHDYAS